MSTQVINNQTTYVDEVFAYQLPPSTPLNYESATDVLNAIMGVRCRDMRAICDYLLQKSQPTEDLSALTFSSELVQNAVQCITEEYKNTKWVGDKEASGNVIRGLFVSMVRIALVTKYPDRVFDIDHEYRILPNKKFAIDEAITTLMVSSAVILGLEYKPKVASTLHDQQAFHITEVLLQAFYLRKRFHHDIVHCLTDLHDFHYFLIGSDADKEFIIRKYWSMKCNITNITELSHHLNFLCENLCVQLWG